MKRLQSFLEETTKECIQVTRITKPGDVTFLFPLYTAYDVMLYIICHLGVSSVLVSKKMKDT
ncbi:hypothetical protein P4U03_29900 [Bacillus mycoides]|uniref:hypothetical protein n=1 Tax=Bacillus cereus group TaxID=86661 RepID=UPI001592E966|nr:MULTISPECIES: hypothetical protein [Bacillus cereus group]MED1270678.1 hypothetical protein [Bacillus mycoides]